MIKRIALTAALTLAVTLTGCATGPKTFNSASELKSAVEAAGIACDQWFTETDWPSPTVEVGNCNVSMVFIIYEPGTDVASEAAANTDHSSVYGSNWMISANSAEDAILLGKSLNAETIIN